MTITVKEVDYSYVTHNMARIVGFSTQAFLGNHKITREAFQRTDARYKHKFEYLMAECIADMMEQIQKHRGLFLVAECDGKLIGISVGCPYGLNSLSEQYLKKVSKSKCRFKEVLTGWWNLMQKFEGTPPEKVYHQAFMAVDPAYAGKGIGTKIGALTAIKIAEAGYAAYAVETSSESADRLAEKLKRDFNVFDIDSDGKGLTLRLHVCREESDKICRWFLDKKGVQTVAKEINVADISTCGVHYHVGPIAVWDSNPKSELPVLILLHSNFACRLFFKNQFEDKRLTDKFRLVALDLPGFGDSLPASDPKKAYTHPGWTEAVMQTIKQLGIKKCALLGWSLGGHVVLEAMDQLEGLCAVAITGTPPVEMTLEGLMKAFKQLDPEMRNLLTKEHISREDAVKISHVIGGESWKVEYILKADGRARQGLGEWIRSGQGRDQRELIAKTPLPTLVIGGDKDPASDRAYLESLKYGNLWGMRFIENCGHNVVQDEAFNPILLQFLTETLK